MKLALALAYSTRDQVELTEQTFLALLRSVNAKQYGGPYIIWCDGSTDEAAIAYYKDKSKFAINCAADVRGGADAAIAWKLTTALRTGCTHIGLIENDVLLDEDWLAPTMELFEKGKRDGLEVGAVSARSYVDRVLIQRNGWAVMHNLGAGMVIFTRQAAELVLRSFRTYWWPSNRYLFAQLSGIDLATYACFGGQEQFVTTDWGWEAQLARHGLASLALTPAKCQMIGQHPPLKEQGLELVTAERAYVCWNQTTDDSNFKCYRDNLTGIRSGQFKIDEPGIIHRQNGGMLFFAHQLGYLAGGPTWQGTLGLRWSQGLGPFGYRAGADGASLSVRVSGSCSFLCSGDGEVASAVITDTRSGFKADPVFPADQIVEVAVPGGPVPREINLAMAPGAVFYGIQTVDPQMLDTTFRFSWDQLPEAE